MKQTLWLLLAILLIVGLAGCPNPYNGGGIPQDGGGSDADTVDPAFWFDGIYEDMLARKPAGGFPVGQIANYKNVCDRINDFWNAGAVPSPGTELQDATCEYLLKMIDQYVNDDKSSYGTSEWATSQILDTTAVDDALNLLCGGKFFIFSDISNVSNNRYLYSVDECQTWIPNKIGDTNGTQWDVYCWANGIHLISNRSTIWRSRDGITWTKTNAANPGSSGGILSITYGNGVFLALGYSYLQLSTDAGKTWTQVTRPILPSLPNAGTRWGNCFFFKGQFLLLGQVMVGGIYVPHAATSTDGINWTVTPLNISGHSLRGAPQYAGMAEINGKLITTIDTGAGRRALVTSTDGINWNTDSVEKNEYNFTPTFYSLGGRLIISFGDYRFNYSDDEGATWTAGTLPGYPISPFSSSVKMCYKNGKYIAAGLGTISSGPSVNGCSVYSSDDLVNWTKISSIAKSVFPVPSAFTFRYGGS